LWLQKAGQGVSASQTSIFERLSSVKNAYWVLLYAAKRLTLWLLPQPGYVMLPLQPRQRFEITIRSEGRKLKHVCAAHEETEAVDRIMRSYKKHSPELVGVKRLGVLPVKLER
jgi:hypothetical protein